MSVDSIRDSQRLREYRDELAAAERQLAAAELDAQALRQIVAGLEARLRDTAPPTEQAVPATVGNGGGSFRRRCAASWLTACDAARIAPRRVGGR